MIEMMLDDPTGGWELIEDKIEIDLCSGWGPNSSGFSKEPYISFFLPTSFEPDGIDDDAPSALFMVSLRDLLQDYLENNFSFDHGKGAPTVSKMLREFADLIDESTKAKRKALNNRIRASRASSQSPKPTSSNRTSASEDHDGR